MNGMMNKQNRFWGMRKALKDHEEESLHSSKSPSGMDRVRHQSTIPIVFEGPNIAMAVTVTSDRYLHILKTYLWDRVRITENL